MKPGNKKPTVAVEINTKGRILTTLPLTVSAILNQTVKPDKLIIYEDISDTFKPGEKPEPSKDWEQPLWKDYLFNHAKLNNVYWVLYPNPIGGQVHGHQHALENADTDYVWRIDDDNIPEPNVLETLLKTAESDEKIGAVGQLVWHPDKPLAQKPDFAKGKMSKGVNHQVPEWFVWDGEPMKVEHLYSTFLYRRKAGLEAGGYPHDLSPVGHHEETIFSHKIHRAGYKLLVTPKCRVWHYRSPEGGIRTHKSPYLWKHDHLKMDILMDQVWKYGDPNEKWIVLKHGIGDQFAFKTLLPEILEQNKDRQVVIATAAPEIFDDVKHDNVIIMHAAQAGLFNIDYDKYNIYAKMNNEMKKGKNLHLIDLFREMYLEDNQNEA